MASLRPRSHTRGGYVVVSSLGNQAASQRRNEPHISFSPKLPKSGELLVPGPGAYDVSVLDSVGPQFLSESKTAVSFSLTRSARPLPSCDEEAPGPGAYAYSREATNKNKLAVSFPKDNRGLVPETKSRATPPSVDYSLRAFLDDVRHTNPSRFNKLMGNNKMMERQWRQVRQDMQTKARLNANKSKSPRRKTRASHTCINHSKTTLKPSAMTLHGKSTVCFTSSTYKKPSSAVGVPKTGGPSTPGWHQRDRNVSMCFDHKLEIQRAAGGKRSTQARKQWRPAGGDDKLGCIKGLGPVHLKARVGTQRAADSIASAADRSNADSGECTRQG
jgi:hypothetical protein